MEKLAEAIKDHLFNNFDRFTMEYECQDYFSLRREDLINRMKTDLRECGTIFTYMYRAICPTLEEAIILVNNQTNYTINILKKEDFEWEIFNCMAEYFIQRTILVNGPLNTKYNIELVDVDFVCDILSMHMDISLVKPVVEGPRFNECYYITTDHGVLFFIDRADTNFCFISLNNTSGIIPQAERLIFLEP